jgi:hypothetical protein
MFKKHKIHLLKNAFCNKSVDLLLSKDFLYYDKTGFELNLAEQKFYQAMSHPINNSIAYHTCWQEPWLELETENTSLILDHCMFLCRCKYVDDAFEQLHSLQDIIPQAKLLIKTITKWGYDFSLDAVVNGEIFDVLHVEYDHRDYDTFNESIEKFETFVQQTDWYDVAKKIYYHKSEWQGLGDFDQDDWKSKYLLGWPQAVNIIKTF